MPLGALRMLGVAGRAQPGKAVVALGLMLCGGLAGPVTALALRAMADGLVAGRSGEAEAAGAAVAALAMVGLVAGHFAHIAYSELSERAAVAFDDRVAQLAHGSPGTAPHDRPELADLMTLLHHEGQRLRTGLETLMSGVALGLTLLVTAALLAFESPALLVLPLLALPSLAAGRWAERMRETSRSAAAAPTRTALNLFRMTASAQSAGEIRVFRLGAELTARHQGAWERASVLLARGQARAAWATAAGQLVFALGYVGAVLLVLREAVDGGRGVGDILLVVVLAVQVNQQVTGLAGLTQELQRIAGAYRRLDELADAVRSAAATLPDPPLAVPRPLLREIRLEGVCFSYPGTDKPVLQDVTLEFPAGRLAAIVGENGAGKTTLIKLLLGLYQPTAGRILLDGKDLAQMDQAAWREQVSAGFQDFVRFELEVRRTVGVGDLARLDDPVAVGDAIDRAQARDVLDRLPEGLETQLGKSYADGAELSGGQWQRLAVARAAMRRSPLLLVLDEPASGLDPAAEHALFEHYARHAGEAAAEAGGISVFVSHRLSTARMVDQIVVLQDGRVAQTGSHAELMRLGGAYAELYTIQARSYA